MATDAGALMASGAAGFLIIGVSVLISVLYTALILWLLAKAFKLHDKKFKTALITALVAGVINFLIRTVLQLTVGSAIGKSAMPAAGAELSSQMLAQGALGLALLLLFWITGFVVDSLAIKKFYKAETGKAFLVGLVLAVIAAIVGFIVLLIFGAILVGVIMAMAA
ncbi:phage holin family protein [Candidatus Woesearchaeota archaeon]|nr:phage holin family protein [Candidatus Woesearchaeota archaeon]